ncbi:MAG: hypothetical protein CDV28_13719 [Candidatus Electronema aureum]|uniref:Uncharacterized protein n=1 Tax=Candidatus Electronema aureum TaxID=2005002 RepID=A0A521FZH4_9BACT|nr:MAG: hypothetical protein CDV28_13719 [Candidatus Electronema aureum]
MLPKDEKVQKIDLLIPRAYLLIGKIYEQTGAAYFLVYFFDEKIGKIDEKV